MLYQCYILEDISGRILYHDICEYMNLCRSYPLLIFPKDNIIVFYSIDIKLEPKEIQLIISLIKNNKIDKNNNIIKKSITAKNLCKAIKYKPRNMVKSIDYDRVITKYKSGIFAKIKKKLNEELKSQHTMVKSDEFGAQYLYGEKLDYSSPYCNFDTTVSINQLIHFDVKFKSKKYSTDFYLNSYNF